MTQNPTQRWVHFSVTQNPTQRWVKNDQALVEIENDQGLVGIETDQASVDSGQLTRL